LMPSFDDQRDDLDAYLKRFEVLAMGQEWPRGKWATALSLCLVGEALKVFGRMSPDDSLDYEKVKMALLQLFRFTTEGYHERFRGSSPNNGKTRSQYAARLEGLFDRWVEMGLCPKTYGDLRDLVIAEQFINGCHLKLAVFLKERSCNALPLMAAAADKFMEAHRQDNLAHFKEDQRQSNNNLKNDLPSSKQETKIKCFLCGRVGHRATDCVSRTEQRHLVCQSCQRSGHDAKACFQRKGGKTQLSSFMVPESG
ncbi:hypothetical protein IscW_ISCW001826, partial [Ixodes scapularis]